MPERQYKLGAALSNMGEYVQKEKAKKLKSLQTSVCVCVCAQSRRLSFAQTSEALKVCLSVYSREKSKVKKKKTAH